MRLRGKFIGGVLGACFGGPIGVALGVAIGHVCDSVSDSSFVLYAPEDGNTGDASKYGFVYNILLPFSTQQSYILNEYSNNAGLSEEQKYQKRTFLLKKG